MPDFCLCRISAGFLPRLLLGRFLKGFQPGLAGWQGWAGLGWLGWAGLGWLAGLGWAGWAGLGWAGLLAGLGWAGLGWAAGQTAGNPRQLALAGQTAGKRWHII